MPPKLLVIAGATAVGKTDLALELAQRLDGEIISADSRQLYRQLDIGTAKPTPVERAVCRHHLIDIAEPDETLSAGQIQRLIADAHAEIASRGRLAMLVGGTGQYITAYLEGWTMPEVPPQPALRAEMEASIRENGLSSLVERLLTLDPDAKSAVDLQNPRRVIRALEVSIVSQQPFSAQRRKNPPEMDIFAVVLDDTTDALFERADRRFDRMMEQGFLEEVRKLLDAGFRRDLPSMSGIGYAELIAHLLDDRPLDEAVEAGKRATQGYIRRQLTWFRKYMRAFLWHNLSDTDNRASLIARVQAWSRGSAGDE
jgi:tRNA dimethylallyltransferase